MIQDEMNLGKILVEDRKTGQECICDGHGVKISTVQEYWQWAYSSLLSNTERGNFAEYLVAVALGIADKTRISWDKYDLISPGGVTVETLCKRYDPDHYNVDEGEIRKKLAPDYLDN